MGALRFATKKAGGSSKNGRDSQAKRLGVKLFGGCVRPTLTFGYCAHLAQRHVVIFAVVGGGRCRQEVSPGNIIIRQRGTKFHFASDGSVGCGRDHTIFAQVEGKVQFTWNRVRKVYSVSVVPSEVPQAVLA